jgi:hypothetical protein
MKCNYGLKRNYFLLIEQNLSKEKSPLSLKNQEKHFTSVEIGIKTCLIHVLAVLLCFFFVTFILLVSLQPWLNGG